MIRLRELRLFPHLCHNLESFRQRNFSIFVPFNIFLGTDPVNYFCISKDSFSAMTRSYSPYSGKTYSINWKCPCTMTALFLFNVNFNTFLTSLEENIQLDRPREPPVFSSPLHTILTYLIAIKCPYNPTEYRNCYILDQIINPSCDLG